MREVFPLGPVNQAKELVQYGFEKKPEENLPVYRYTYPGGSHEEFRDYGGYFGAYWTPDSSLTHDDLVNYLGGIPNIDNSPNGYEVKLIGNHTTVFEVGFDNANEIREAFDAIKNERGHTYSLDSGIGSFFWEVNTEGQITGVGVLTYNGAPTDSVLDWQRRTAHPEIVQRGDGFVALNLPPEEHLSVGG